MGVEIKICGLTNRVDAQAAIDMGADYLGFVLYPESPRAVTPEQLVDLLAGLRGEYRAVGVFVNESCESVERVVESCGLHAAQVHGDESAEAFSGTGCVLWRALWVEDGLCRPDPAAWPAARYVVDASVPGLYGGTGVTADWEQAARVAESVQVMLAGGLTADNVAEAIRVVSPAGVDVSGGVERRPGKKDPAEIERFIAAVRGSE